MRNEWTAWRNANYEFFSSQLEGSSTRSTLLDLGSGEEQFADVFHKFNYTSLDFEDFGDTKVIHNLNEPLPFSDESFDIITISNAIEHIPDTQQLLNECYRVLKKGGLFLATTPFLVNMHQEPFDFNRYTIYAHKRFLERAGFSFYEVRPIGNLLDAYNTLELKTFDDLREKKSEMNFPQRIIFEFLRTLRRVEMRVLRKIYKYPSNKRITEGFSTVARK